MEIENGEHRTANYSNFMVANEFSKYQLTVTGYSGDAGGNHPFLIISKWSDLTLKRKFKIP